MRLSLLLFLMFCAGCSTAPMSKEKRTWRFQQKLSGSQDQLFVLAKSYFAEEIVDSNDAIKLEDKDSGKLIVRIADNCAPENGIDKMNAQGVLYNYVVNVQTNKLRLRVEAKNNTYTNSPRGDIPAQTRLYPIPSGEGWKPALDKCVKKQKDKFFKYLKEESSFQ